MLRSARKATDKLALRRPDDAPARIARERGLDIATPDEAHNALSLVHRIDAPAIRATVRNEPPQC